MKSLSLLTCAALLSSTSLVAQDKMSTSTKGQPCCQAQGEYLECYGPAFNAPAAINVSHKDFKCCPSQMNYFLDASFIYWYAGQDGMKVASSGVLNGTSVYYAPNTLTYNQSFNYKPGFKVGMGLVGAHEWQFHAEYTWFRARNSSNSGALPTGTVNTAGSTTLTGTNVWLVDDWFLQGVNGQALSGNYVTSQWRLAMDVIDAVMGRPFYQSRRLVVSPYTGIRSAFIREEMRVKLTESTAITALPSQPISSRNYSHSWSIGPRVGCDGEWLLCYGLRLEGNFAASLLYTRYTSIKHTEDAASTGFNAGPYTANQTGYGCLRPEIDTGLGIGWGMYLGCRDYHIDFAADYDFNYFWSQNVLRTFLDDTLTGTGPGASDLYLHGLTITGRFDF